MTDRRGLLGLGLLEGRLLDRPRLLGDLRNQEAPVGLSRDTINQLIPHLQNVLASVSAIQELGMRTERIRRHIQTQMDLLPFQTLRGPVQTISHEVTQSLNDLADAINRQKVLLEDAKAHAQQFETKLRSAPST